MSRTMRTLPLLVVLLIVGCTDNAAPHGANFASVTGLFVASCGHTEHEFRCWGNLSDLFGQAGSQAPVRLAAPYGSLQSVATSGSEGCGLDVAGALYCWGFGSPYAAVAPDLRFSQVVVGQAHRCALATGGTLYCWGATDYSGVNPANPTIRDCSPTPLYAYSCVPFPQPVAGNERFKAVSVGYYHTCALTEGGQVLCWGEGAVGQIGQGPDSNYSRVPHPISSPDRFSGVASAAWHSCAVSTASRVLCWGSNYSGEIGTGSAVAENYTPAPISVPATISMKSVALGEAHSCALDASGAAWCWGTAGIGTGAPSSPLPALVLGRLTFRSLGAGSDFTCGVSDTGAWCWGANNYGQLGNGSTTESPIPVRVANQDQFD